MCESGRYGPTHTPRTGMLPYCDVFSMVHKLTHQNPMPYLLVFPDVFCCQFPQLLVVVLLPTATAVCCCCCCCLLELVLQGAVQTVTISL